MQSSSPLPRKETSEISHLPKIISKENLVNKFNDSKNNYLADFVKPNDNYLKESNSSKFVNFSPNIKNRKNQSNKQNYSDILRQHLQYNNDKKKKKNPNVLIKKIDYHQQNNYSPDTFSLQNSQNIYQLQQNSPNVSSEKCNKAYFYSASNLKGSIGEFRNRKKKYSGYQNQNQLFQKSGTSLMDSVIEQQEKLQHMKQMSIEQDIRETEQEKEVTEQDVNIFQKNNINNNQEKIKKMEKNEQISQNIDQSLQNLRDSQKMEQNLKNSQKIDKKTLKNQQKMQKYEKNSQNLGESGLKDIGGKVVSIIQEREGSDLQELMSDNQEQSQQGKVQWYVDRLEDVMYLKNVQFLERIKELLGIEILFIQNMSYKEILQRILKAVENKQDNQQPDEKYQQALLVHSQQQQEIARLKKEGSKLEEKIQKQEKDYQKLSKNLEFYQQTADTYQSPHGSPTNISKEQLVKDSQKVINQLNSEIISNKIVIKRQENEIIELQEQKQIDMNEIQTKVCDLCIRSIDCMRNALVISYEFEDFPVVDESGFVTREKLKRLLDMQEKFCSLIDVQVKQSQEQKLKNLLGNNYEQQSPVQQVDTPFSFSQTTRPNSSRSKRRANMKMNLELDQQSSFKIGQYGMPSQFSTGRQGYIAHSPLNIPNNNENSNNNNNEKGAIREKLNSDDYCVFKKSGFSKKEMENREFSSEKIKIKKSQDGENKNNHGKGSNYETSAVKVSVSKGKYGSKKAVNIITESPMLQQINNKK